jgi:hypothetical protein
MVATTRAEAIKAVEAIFERYVGIFSGCLNVSAVTIYVSLSGLLSNSEVSVI